MTTSDSATLKWIKFSSVKITCEYIQERHLIDGRSPAKAFSNVCSSDLDLDPMTSIYELDLDILKGCMYTENEVSKSVLP